MGMAASQARYLALTARKTNTEWEGQQINQARTALANQSANLFNRLLGLEVPNPPSKTDFTEMQYSYSDGDNESVIEKWERIGNNDADYNYVVKHYYMADIYQGHEKLLQNPEVQLGDVLKELNYDHKTTTVVKNGNDITVTYKINDDSFSQPYEKITQAQVDADNDLKAQLTNFETAKNMAKEDGSLTTDAVYGYRDTDGTWHFFIANISEETTNAEKLNADLRTYETDNNLLNEDGSLNFDYVYGIKGFDDNWNFINTKGYNEVTKKQVDEDNELKTALTNWERDNELLAPDGSLTYNNIFAQKDDSGNWNFMTTNGYNKITATDATPYMAVIDYTDYSTVYGPSYVGNSKLTELNKLIQDESKGIDQVTELAQILKDFPDSSLNKYISFDAEGNLIYEGSGIYTFNILGKSYYATKSDLINSATSAYNPSMPIETQEKLPYYSASMVSKKIEESNKALLETDKNGRFTSVKFDNDSNTYHLNVETVTNEVAYEDAMNDYQYKKAQYEKTIADINAKTSIIQKEDRTLELRLKQLDTEQHALATEMDAVKKVIKDNVEKTFKTFSD